MSIFGDFVFTTIRASGSNVHSLDAHLDRLFVHAVALGYPTQSRAQLSDAVLSSTSTFAADAPQQLHSLTRVRLGHIGQFGYDVETMPLHIPTASQYDSGVRVVCAQHQVHPQLSLYKTGNYLPYLQSRRHAESVGAFEGLLCDADGHIVDGSRTSPLFYHDGTLTLAQGGLDGITRNQVAQHARLIGLNVVKKYVHRNEQLGQLLIAGTGVGLLSHGAPCDDVVKQLVQRFRLDVQV